MSDCTVRLTLDADQVQADLRLLSDAAQRSPEVAKRLLDAGDLAAQVRCIDVDALSAREAGEHRVRLELSDALAELVRALRAGDFDDLLVQ